MKLLSLGLRKFGHFNARTLQFEGAPRGGLYLIQGSNEAGKTTALKAVRALLFGIPTRAAHLAIGFEQAQLAVEGAVAFDSGATATMVRTKNPLRGTKSTLSVTVPGGDDFDEDWFRAKLGSPTEDMYEQIFAFSLDALEKGADLLLSNEAVKGALYGAGLGGAVKPSDVLSRLQDEKDALFVASGNGKKALNLAKAKLAELGERVRVASQGSDAYAALEREQATAEADANEKLAELDRLYKAREQNNALAKALEVHQLREANARELASLAVPLGFDPELGARALAAYADEARLAAEEDETARRIAALADEDSALVFDETLVAKARRLEQLARTAGAQRQTRAEAKDLVRDEAHAKQDALRTLATLRPGWTLERLTSLTLDEATKQRLSSLLDKETFLQTSIAEAARSERGARDAAQRDERSLTDLAPVESTVALEAWLSQMPTATALHAQIDDAARALSLVEKKRDQALARLDPKPAGKVDLERVLPPTVQMIDAARTSAAKIEGDRARAEEQLRDADDRIARATAEIAMIDANERAPSEAELADARAHRDRLGDALFAAFDPANVQAYKDAIGKTDEMADRMRLRAEAVQKRALQERQRALAAVDRERADHARQIAVTLADTHSRSWKALWTTTGVEPLDPERMRAWRLAWEDFVAQGPQLADATAKVTTLREREASFVREGAALVGDASVTTLGTLQKLADAKVNAARARLKALEERRAAAAQHARAEADAREKKAQLEAELAAWSTSWKSASEGLANDGETFSTADARAVLQKLIDLQRKVVEGAEVRATRSAKLAASHAEFDRAVNELLGETNDAQRADAVTRVEAAYLAARAAEKAAERRIELARETKALIDRKTETAETRARLRTIVHDARTAAGTTDDATVRAIAGRARDAETLARTIEQQDRELARLRGSSDAAPFLAALREASEPMLREKNEALAADVARLQAERSALHVRIGAAEERRKAFDGGSTAAERAADLEAERALMREQVERYAVAAIAHELLTRGIRRFEKDHQPRLLSRAGELFATMTGGSFVRVQQNLEGRIVVVRAGDHEAEVEPQHLSTGTNEQLFLALRLAYIEAYARPGVEPLPVVLDDVLVNFDDARALATLRALVGFAEKTQVLFFTCHAHLIKLAADANLDLPVLTLSRELSSDAAKPSNDPSSISTSDAQGPISGTTPAFELTAAPDETAKRRRRSSGPK